MYEESYLRLTADDLSLKLPIRAQILPCIAIKLGFAQPLITLRYELGSEQLDFVLPKPIERPDCSSKEAPGYSMRLSDFQSNLEDQVVLSAINFDSLSNLLIIDTEDLSFAEQSIALLFVVDQNV